VLFTGATGGTGSVILEHLLRDGYTVNAILRSFAKSKDALSKQYASYISNDKLRFTEIPDMAVPGVFDEPAKGASGIIHAATPISDSDFENTMIKGTVAINENVLKAAATSGSVKRVVITGSAVTVMKLPDQLMSGETFTEKDYNPVTHEEALQNLPNAYQYSKVHSEKKAWEWVESNKPPFELLFLLVPSITGRTLQHGFKPNKAGLGGISMMYREIFDRDTLGFIFPYYLDVDDVARVHIRSLSPQIPGNERYLFAAKDFMDTAAVANRIREVFPWLRDRVPVG
ncbi:NAD(P)-binding protein, partial [Rhizodiscina lignyota]